MSDFRKPRFLSPSSLAVAERCWDEFFYRYICPKDCRPEKPPQTGPMSVGSAFDALVKSALYKLLFGDNAAKVDGYTIRKLVTDQCEEHTLPDSLVIAIDVFEQYVESGAYGNLVELIRQSGVSPRMEFDVVKDVEGVPLLGKPDLHFHTNLHCHVITDWKVSGSVSKCGVSPQQGYALVLDIWNGRGNGLAHPKFVPGVSPCGVIVNKVPMNETTDYWADQLTTYAWCLDEPIGSQDFIARIEQLACRPTPSKADDGRLRVRCVTHQSTVDADYQRELIERYKRVWGHVDAGHYFPELSKSESDARANHLVRKLRNPVLLPPDLSANDVSLGGLL